METSAWPLTVLINAMIAKWREGFDVVYAKRISRSADTAVKRSSAGLFYRIFNRLSEMPIPENVGDFRLMDRRVVEAIKMLPEKDRFMKGLFCWPGFSNTTIEFERKGRIEGISKFNYWKLWNFALEGLTSFSTAPLRMATYVGLATALLAFGYGVWIVAKALLYGDAVQGWPTMMAVILFLGGSQLIALGLIGEYLGRLYLESKQRPLYLVDAWLPAEAVQLQATRSTTGVHDAYGQASAGGEGA